MALALHYHPLSSYCWKVLIAFYENGAAFEPRVVDLMDPNGAAAFKRISPFMRMPVLEDSARGETLFESSIIIEYLDTVYPGAAPLLPRDPAAALEVRAWDRVFDLYVHEPLQKIVFDRLRPKESRDAFGVAQAHERLGLAYENLAERMSARIWAAGDGFTLADCAACPALHYANKVEPIGAAPVAAYLKRLEERASFARVLNDAAPFAHLFPTGD